MGLDNIGVVRVQDGGLKGSFKEICGVFHEILIQCIGFSHEDHHRFSAGAANPPPPLPGIYDGARIAYQQTDIKISDIDPHL